MGANTKPGGSSGNPPWSRTGIELHPIDAAEQAFATGRTTRSGWPDRTVQRAGATNGYRRETPLLLILAVAGLALAQIALGPTTAQLCERMADVTFGP